MKTIVITGATSGVGLTCVDHFLNKGWCVIGIARTLKGSKKHKNFHFIKADIKKYSDVKLAFDIIKKEFNKIDILINNASIFKTKQFIKFDNAEIDNILDTNVKGTMYCTLESIKLMTNESRIINLGSVSGLYGIKNQAVYSASKHAINGFAESLSQETNIKITTIICISRRGNPARAVPVLLRSKLFSFELRRDWAPDLGNSACSSIG